MFSLLERKLLVGHTFQSREQLKSKKASKRAKEASKRASNTFISAKQSIKWDSWIGLEKTFWKRRPIHLDISMDWFSVQSSRKHNQTTLFSATCSGYSIRGSSVVGLCTETGHIGYVSSHHPSTLYGLHFVRSHGNQYFQIQTYNCNQSYTKHCCMP